ncbi:hypothetical protein C8Q77DRAFT_500499 [Trametes polyzona]|nr:hypothetical protein C8Q77DRAFT_500499 [Trametes polyzona]
MCIPKNMMSLYDHYRSSLAHPPVCECGGCEAPLGEKCQKCLAEAAQAQQHEYKQAGGDGGIPDVLPKPATEVPDVILNVTAALPNFGDVSNTPHEGGTPMIGDRSADDPLRVAKSPANEPPRVDSAAKHSVPLAPLAIPSSLPPAISDEGAKRTLLDVPRSAIEYDRFTDDADRSSIIAKAALDILTQRYGMGAASRVLRVMQELGGVATEGQSDGGFGSQLRMLPLSLQHTGQSFARSAEVPATPKDDIPVSRCSSPPSAVRRFVESQSRLAMASQFTERGSSPSDFDSPKKPLSPVVTPPHEIRVLGSPKAEAPPQGGPPEASSSKPAPRAKVPRTSSNSSSAKVPKTSSSSAKAQSWHCRSCMAEVCIEPVATVCGHVFCRGCLLRELQTRGACPVCHKLFLLQLDVGL